MQCEDCPDDGVHEKGTPRRRKYVVLVANKKQNIFFQLVGK